MSSFVIIFLVFLVLVLVAKLSRHIKLDFFVSPKNIQANEITVCRNNDDQKE